MTAREIFELKANMAFNQPASVSVADIHDLVDTFDVRTTQSVSIKTTNYTALLSDNRTTICFNSASPVTFSLPANTPPGWECVVYQGGAGQVTVTAIQGTVLSRGDALMTAGLYAIAYLFCASNIGSHPQIVLTGDITTEQGAPVIPAVAMEYNYATSKALRTGDVLSRLTSGTYFSSGGTLTSSAANTPRFDHDPSNSNVSLGLLVEPELYNFPNNRNPSAWSNNFTVTFVANSGTGLDGTNSLTRVNKTGASGCIANGFLTSRYASVLTVSAYVKVGDFDSVYLQLENTDFVGVTSAQFNLTAGTVLGGSVGSTIASMGNGIYRITVLATNLNFKWGYVRVGLNNSNTSGYFLFDGIQVDVGTRPSSLASGLRRSDVLDVAIPTGAYDILVKYPAGGDWLLGRQSIGGLCRVNLRNGKGHLSEIRAWTAGLLSQNQRNQVFTSDAPVQVLTPAFSDEFSTLSLDTLENGGNTWVTRFVGWNTHRTGGNNDLCFKTHSGFVGAGSSALGVTLHEIVGGNLKLYAMPTPAGKEGNVTENGTSYPYVGGMISSELKYAQQYGYWECRARFAVTKSQHWSMYMLSSDEQWPPEIDMVEIAGWENTTGSTLVTMNFHDIAGKVPEQNQAIFAPATGPGEWHTYGFYWDDHDMIWYFDGVEKLRCANFINKPMYFLITPEIASDWPGPPNETTVWPTTAEIDYLRVSKFMPL